MELQQTLLSTEGAHAEPPGFIAFEYGFLAATFRTVYVLTIHFSRKDHRITHILRGLIFNTLETKSMIYYSGN